MRSHRPLLQIEQTDQTTSHTPFSMLKEIRFRVGRNSPLPLLKQAGLSLLILTAIGCSDLGTDPSTPTSQNSPVQTQEVSFQNHVRPIFQSFECTSCHGGSGGLTVTTVTQLLSGGNHGPAIVAGKSESSTLITKLSARPPFGSRMPQGGPYLPDSTIQIIARWINQGAKNN